MFKYSKNWLSKITQTQIDYKDFDKNWLDLQGFEISTEEKVGDDEIIEIEVKANRPDMLSHLGVWREFNVYKGGKTVPNILSTLDYSKFGSPKINVKIETKDIGNVALIEIKNVDNSGETPSEIQDLLSSFGIKSISPIVDLGNYIMLEIGQPIHIYDLDKLGNTIKFSNSLGGEKITTLNGDDVEIPQNSIVISNDDGIVCLAGIIGTKDVEITKDTKNILIESAYFDAVKIRIASQKTHISTLASYRFERGIDSDNSVNAGCVIAENITNVCGGEIVGAFIVNQPKPDNVIKIDVNKVNSLIGIKITAKEIKDLLETYYYSVKIITNDVIEAICPRYRLDLELDVDVIADIAQIYGYHNIEPTTTNLSVKYEPNYIKIYSDKLRELMLGCGINECISYSFIADDAIDKMGIDKESKLWGDITIMNPLSNKFAIMRSTMLYSMINTYTYNLSKNNECEPIFELGSVFFRDTKSDTGYNQKTMLAVLLNGNKINKGFGIDKNIVYDFYDMKSILQLITEEFVIDVELKNTKEHFFEKGLGAEIFVNGVFSGHIGVLKSSILPNFENGKLISGQVLFMELCVDNLTQNSTKIGQISKFPSVFREYNLLVANDKEFKKYSSDIKDISNTIISLDVNDIYKGKGVDDGYTSVLIAIEYSSIDKTLSSEEIEVIENQMLDMLKNKYDIKLKI